MHVNKGQLMEMTKEQLVEITEAALTAQEMTTKNMVSMKELITAAGEKIKELESEKQTMEAEIIPTEEPSMTTPIHTIEALCERSHAISFEKGWVTAEGDPRSYACITNLNHSELSEAMEDWRNNKLVTEVWYDCGGLMVGKAERDRSTEPPGNDPAYWKPCGIPVELADFVIRVCQHVGTAKLGGKLQACLLCNIGIVQRSFADFDDMLAKTHHDVSMSFYNQTHGDSYLDHLANALANVFSFCDQNGIDLWSAIDEKEAYNRTRSAKHGGKKV